MTSQLAAIQIHLWVLTGVVCLLIVANVLCNLSHAKRDDGYHKMKQLWEAKRTEELLAYTNARLQHRPASSMLLMYKAMALLRLARLDEAEVAAQAFKETSPNLHDTAVNLTNSIAELRAKLG